MTIYELSTLTNAAIILRCFPGQAGRWMCFLDRTEVAEAGMLVGLYGEAPSPEEALADYVSKLRGQSLVVRGSSDTSMRVTVPTTLTVGGQVPQGAPADPTRERDVARQDLVLLQAEHNAQVHLTTTLTARIIELEAALANEHGAGIPPVAGWRPVRVYAVIPRRYSLGWQSGDLIVTRIEVQPWRAYRVANGILEALLDADGSLVSASTARETIRRAASLVAPHSK